MAALRNYHKPIVGMWSDRLPDNVRIDNSIFTATDDQHRPIDRRKAFTHRMALGSADRFEEGLAPQPGLKLLLVITNDARTRQRRVVKRAFDQSAIVFMAGAFGDRQALFAPHARRTQQH